MKFGDYIKYSILIIVLLLIAPGLIRVLISTYQEVLQPKTRVGRVTIEGIISHSTTSIENIKKLLKNPNNKALLIVIDSGGGAAGAAQALFTSIKELKALYKKPIFVYVENICASGAYYAACAGDVIITSPSAFLGSIGVYIPHPELKELINDYKIYYNVIKTGTYKAACSPFMQDSPEQIAMLQGLTDDTYKQFITDVASQRKALKLEDETTWAQGRIFTGNQALALGLIDAIGSLTTAEAMIKEKLGITTDIEWADAPKPSKLAAFFENLTLAKSFLAKIITPTGLHESQYYAHL